MRIHLFSGFVLFAWASAGCGLVLGLGDFKDGEGGAAASSSSTGTSTTAGQSSDTSTSSSTSASGTGGASTTSTTTSSAGGGGATPVSNVVITQNLIYVTDGQQKIVQPDLSGVMATVLVPNGNGFDAHTHAGALGGTVTVPDIPEGTPYYLKLGTTQYANQYFVLTSHSVDLSYPVFGPPTQVAPTKPTPITLNFSAMSAWTAMDGMQLICAASGTGAFAVQTSANPTFTLGEKMGFITVDSSLFVEPNLVDGSAFPFLLHDTPAMTANGVAYSALTQYALVKNLDQVDGQSSTWTGAFSSAPAAGTAPLNWKITEFDALASAVNPSATANAEAWGLEAIVGQASLGVLFTASPILLEMTPAVGSTVDVSIPYQNPLAAGWFLFDRAETQYVVMHTASGAAPGPSLVTVGDIALATDVAAAGGVIAPTLSPVTMPKVGAVDFFAGGMTSSTPTPTLSWQAPTTGKPTSYTVGVWNLFSSGGNTKESFIGSVTTNGTSVQLPNALVTAGQQYFFIIKAFEASGVVYDSTPAAQSLPFAYAQAVSGTFTAQ